MNRNGHNRIQSRDGFLFNTQKCIHSHIYYITIYIHIYIYACVCVRALLFVYIQQPIQQSQHENMEERSRSKNIRAQGYEHGRGKCYRKLQANDRTKKQMVMYQRKYILTKHSDTRHTIRYWCWFACVCVCLCMRVNVVIQRVPSYIKAIESFRIYRCVYIWNISVRTWMRCERVIREKRDREWEKNSIHRCWRARGRRRRRSRWYVGV